MLYNNTTDIEPAVHSTDTHGVNNVNFWILHAFGYQFAPRYRNLRGKSENGLYGFNDPIHYENFLDDITVWRNVQRALNRGEAYQQLRRLVSHANFGRLKAKTELGNRYGMNAQDSLPTALYSTMQLCYQGCGRYQFMNQKQYEINL